MGKVNTIQIIGDGVHITIETETEMTQTITRRMERQLNAVLNENLYHDIYGRITSINMSIYMLERMTPPDAKKHMQLLKSQVEDLSRMFEDITG